MPTENTFDVAEAVVAIDLVRAHQMDRTGIPGVFRAYRNEHGALVVEVFDDRAKGLIDLVPAA